MKRYDQTSVKFDSKRTQLRVKKKKTCILQPQYVNIAIINYYISVLQEPMKNS